MLRTIFLGGNIFCITNQVYLKNNLKNFLRKVFESYITEIFVINIQEYNEYYRMKVYSSIEKNSFVFNMDANVIIKQIFKEKIFKEDKFNLEKSLILGVKKNIKDEDICSYLNSKVKTIFITIEEIIKKIKSGDISNKKEIQNYFFQKTKIEISLDLIQEIMKNRFNFDLNKYLFNIDEKVDKIKSLF